MAIYTVGAKSAGAGSTTLPTMSLYGSASSGFRLIECGIFNTTAVAFDIKLIRLSATGTQGAGLTEGGYDPQQPASQAQGFNTHTVTAANTDLGYRASIGAAIGAGVIWTFGDTGIMTTLGVANGIGFMVENGTGQIAQCYFVWRE